MTQSRHLKLKIIFGIITVCLLGAILISSVPKYKAYTLMSLVSFYEEMGSRQEVSLKIPTQSRDTDWFPKMIVFNDKGGFNQLSGLDVDLTIYYSFGNFETKDFSSIFDPSSPYYSGFYGGYLVKGINEDISLNPDLLAMIPSYDYENLILRDLGCPQSQRYFDYKVLSQDLKSYINEENWQCYDLLIETSGVYHTPVQDRLHYIQFGRPVPSENVDSFTPVTLYGRVYAKYFEALDTEVILYILSSDLDLLEKTDIQVLSKSYIDQ